ncbi:MAG: serine protein kinase PrkA [Syntrophales bacterium]
MTTEESILNFLSQRITERENRTALSLKDYVSFAARNPTTVFRNTFQMLYDMIRSYVGEGVDEYPDDPESIHHVLYDCTKLFVDGVDHPFFADQLFANRLINQFASFRSGSQQNRIYIFEGPHGCGKSTFLNNLLLKFEQYTKTTEGTIYETVWRLNKKVLGVMTEHETHAILTQLKHLADDSTLKGKMSPREGPLYLPMKDYLEVPCPSHDSPLILVPKHYRKEVFDQLIMDREFKEKLFTEKQYEWVFRDNPCTICVSLYTALLDIVNSPEKVFDMIFARPYEFNRRLGQGISVFNPGDPITKTNVQTNELLQSQLNNLLKDSNRVRYIYSRYANTNNGIYAIMDVKDNNKDRFANLHGIISEGVHKVEDIEENVNSLFLALMNPEDRVNIVGTQSFLDRISFIKIPYVLDYNTEVKIYKNIFGDRIEKMFLPRVLQNFAKIIIATRMKEHSENLLEWIGDPVKYAPYCDRNLQLLKMDIYAGFIPSWLSQEDRKNFTAKKRKAVIAESESEGEKGFSGRDSIKIFNDFYSAYAKEGTLISMAMVCNFFRQHQKEHSVAIPDGFLDSLVDSYNYAVLQEVKESLYDFNEERISKDIQNYLFAVNFEPGRTEKCIYTGETIDLTEEFFSGIESRIIGAQADISERLAFRREIQNQYTAKTLTQEILLEGKEITATTIYAALRERYIFTLKEKVMDPFLKNENFRRGIKDYNSEAFKTYDQRIRNEVRFLIQNLVNRYGYCEQGAREICIYVLDSELAPTFSLP